MMKLGEQILEKLVIIHFKNSCHPLYFSKCWGHTKIILSVVFYGCEMWTLTLREENKFASVWK